MNSVNAPKLLFFETHPIQYRAPIFRKLEELLPGSVEVAYASDASIRGYRDPGFGAEVIWDTPLLEGYRSTFLHAERRGSGFLSLSSKGVLATIERIRPSVVFLHSLHSEYCWAAYFIARAKGLPIWLRVETQDEAFARPKWKTVARSMLYRSFYKGIDRAFYIGKLNRSHLLAHCIPTDRLRPAHYCVPDPLSAIDESMKSARRSEVRRELGIACGQPVIAFFGKLIEKKNPALIVRAVAALMREGQAGPAPVLLFVGSGPLQPQLETACQSLLPLGVRCVFTGFVNQSRISDYYLAADIAILPSRQAGETWGLVVNEAMQAGCSVIMSNAVGSHADFGTWPRVRVIRDDDVVDCVGAMRDLIAMPRDLNWAGELLVPYSTSAAALSIANEFTRFVPNRPLRRCADA